MKLEKYCKRCDKTLTFNNFTKSSSRYDGLQPYCKNCMKLYRKENYRANKQAYNARNKARKCKLRDIVLVAKREKCCDCGVSYPNEPWLMEFDHRNPQLKSFNIFQLVNNGSESKLISELNKCDLVCVLCHRKRTAKFFKWKVNRFQYGLANG